MPYEVLGVDLSTNDGREAFADVWSFFGEYSVGVPAEMDLGPDEFDSWIQVAPNEVKDFLVFCSDHQSPDVRGFAGISVDRLMVNDVDFALGIIEKLATDKDENVRDRVSSYYSEILTDGGFLIDEYIEKNGIYGIRRLIKAIRSAQTFPGTNADQAR